MERRRCCDAANPGSNQQHGYKSHATPSCYKSYPSVEYHTESVLCVFSSAVFIVPRLTAVKGNIKNEGPAMGQFPCETKHRGRANHPWSISLKNLNNIYICICIHTDTYIYIYIYIHHCHTDKIIDIGYKLRTNGKYKDFSVSVYISMPCHEG